MSNIYSGDYSTPSGRFGLVAARFNQVIVESLVQGAKDALLRHGVLEGVIDVAWVPGSVEIPLVAKKFASTGKYSAIIGLGAVIRGETTHFDHVAGAATSGLTQVGLEFSIPVIFGVLTCETLEQAINRSGAKAGNKGFDAGLAAIEMVNLLRSIDSGQRSDTA